MSQRIIFLRHGQTPANLARALDTQPPGRPLTDTGIQQAQDAGRQLAHLVGAADGSTGSLGRVIVSEAVRAQQTGQYALDTLLKLIGLDSAPTELTPHVVPGIHEISAGIYEDATTDESYRAYMGMFAGFLHGDRTATVPEGETLDDFLGRYLPAVTSNLELAQQGELPGQDLLVVSHGAAIRTITCLATGCSPRLVTEHYLDNCGFSIVKPGGRDFGNWELLHWSGIDHPE